MRINSIYRKAKGMRYGRGIVTALLLVAGMSAQGVVHRTSDSGPAYHSPYGEQYSGSFLPQAGVSPQASDQRGGYGPYGNVYGGRYGAAIPQGQASGSRAYGTGRRYSGPGHLSGSSMAHQGTGGYGGVMRRVLVWDPETETYVDDGTGPASGSGEPTTSGTYVGETATGTDGRQYRWTLDGWVLNTTSEADLPLGDGLWLLLLPAGVYAFGRRKRMR